MNGIPLILLSLFFVWSSSFYQNKTGAIIKSNLQTTENLKVQFAKKRVEGDHQIMISEIVYRIPENIKDKISQPFFAAKPTGQCSGLGLSLSNDIVKAHVGTLKVSYKTEEGTKSVLDLPTASKK
jgi:C4-dicarboxylate-specific signal transduction histidine kinase